MQLRRCHPESATTLPGVREVLGPRELAAYSNLVGYQFALRRFHEARATIANAKAHNRTDTCFVFQLYALAFLACWSPDRTPWDALHRAHFNGYALRTYLTTPYLLAMNGLRVEETEPWSGGAEAERDCRLCGSERNSSAN